MKTALLLAYFAFSVVVIWAVVDVLLDNGLELADWIKDVLP